MSTEKYPCYFLPFINENEIREKKTITFTDGGKSIEFEYPILTKDIIEKIFTEIHKAKNLILEKMSVNEIIDICDKVSKLWMDKKYPLRKYAFEWLPCITGFSKEMVELSLEKMMEGLNKTTLTMMIEEELGRVDFLDKFTKKERINILSRAYGPDVILEIFSGNVPGLPILDIFCGLLVKSAIMAKPSSKEPLFANLIARTIREVSPELENCLAICYWEGGDNTIEPLIIERCNTVIAYGGIQSIGELGKKIPRSIHYIQYGHKISFGIIGKEKLNAQNSAEIARKAAYDVAIFDQQGCLSPHVFFVEENPDCPPKMFAEKLANAMEGVNTILPPSRPEISLIVQINNIRTLYEAKEINNEDVKVFFPEKRSHWTVIYENTKEFTPSCLYRVIRVVPFSEFDDLIKMISPIKAFLQTVGICLDQKRELELCTLLGKLGVTRFTLIGQMTDVPVFWHHDGRYNILDLIRWVDIQK